MGQVCHAHCPKGGCGLAGVAAALLAAGIALAVYQVVASLFAVIMITGGVACVAGVVLVVVLIRRDRVRSAVPAAVPARALPAARRVAAVEGASQLAIEGVVVPQLAALRASCDDVLTQVVPTRTR